MEDVTHIQEVAESDEGFITELEQPVEASADGQDLKLIWLIFRSTPAY